MEKNSTTYSEWINNGCQIETWDGDTRRLSVFSKSLIGILAIPFRFCRKLLGYKIEEMWKKTFIALKMIVIDGHDYMTCSIKYMCIQEAYRTLHDALYMCEITRMLCLLRDLKWSIKPSSVYNISTLNLYDYMSYFFEETMFAIEIMDNIHTLEEVECHKENIYYFKSKMLDEFKEKW